MPTERSKPDHPTFGPPWLPGVSWATYFTKMRCSGSEPTESDVEQEEDAEPEPEVEIIIPGHELSDNEIEALPARGKPAQVVKRLIAQGWKVRVRQSLVHVPAVLYKTDSKEGTPAEKAHQKGDVRFVEHDLETTVLLAQKRVPNDRGGLALEATWTRKITTLGICVVGDITSLWITSTSAFELSQTFDPWLGREIRVGYLKPRKPNQIEIEEGIQPPVALNDWLNMVAKRPEPKKKEAK